MSGVLIDIQTQGEDVISERLQFLATRMEDLTPVMKTIGETIRASVIRNFEKGGRPKLWKGHGPLTQTRRGKSAKILREHSNLMNSVTYTAGRDSVQIGTNIIYAAVHQFGAEKGSFGTVQANVKAHVRKIKSRDIKKGRKKTASGVAFVAAHTRKMRLPYGDIPARPFLMIQDEDVTEIGKLIQNHIAKIKGK